MSLFSRLRTLIPTGGAPDRVVPRSGATARLTVLSAAAMAFLAVFALSLSIAAGRLAGEWSRALDGGATIRLADPARTDAVLALLSTTPGVTSSHVVDAEEAARLLEPWLGPDLPLADLPLPALIEVEGGAALDLGALALRLEAEAPGAVLDDHGRWREPLAAAAGRLRLLALFSVLLIAGTTGAVITLAANAALATNAQPIRVLRLVGARDDYIAQAFVRRFTLRALSGAAGGTALGVVALALMPESTGGVLPALGLRGAGWLLPLAVPLVAGIIALLASRRAALRILGTFQ